MPVSALPRAAPLDRSACGPGRPSPASTGPRARTSQDPGSPTPLPSPTAATTLAPAPAWGH
eukprot:4420913-Pleurochrysis_carterae.AAC.1